MAETAGERARAPVFELVHSGYHHPVLRQWQQADVVLTPQHLMYPLFIT